MSFLVAMGCAACGLHASATKPGSLWVPIFAAGVAANLFAFAGLL